MTENEVNILRQTLPPYVNGVRRPLTNEEEFIDFKTQVALLMISNLTYGESYWDMVEKEWYLRNHTKFDWEIAEEEFGIEDGRKWVSDLWNEMKSDFEKYAVVHNGVYTDYEGCSYNEVEWSK